MDKSTNDLTPFATVDELRAFCGADVDTDDTARIESLLIYASNYLRQIARNNGVDIDVEVDNDELTASTVKSIVMASVKRALNTPANAPAAGSWAQAATPYSQTISNFENPGGDIYFKNNELKLLGFSSIGKSSQFGILRGIK